MKQTLAASLHEIARMLGDHNDVEDELVPIFEEMIQVSYFRLQWDVIVMVDGVLQDVEEVQMGVMKNLAVFLSLLSEPCRVSYLPILHDILHSTNPFNWRLRQVLAMQLPELIDLPPKCEVFGMLFPLLMTLLQDPVAEVRKNSFHGVAKLINILYDLSQQLEVTPRGEDSKDESNQGNASSQSPSSPSTSTSTQQLRSKRDLDAVIRSINSLIRGDSYYYRQLWLDLNRRLLREIPKELYEQYFIDGILKLTVDSVCNVRVAVAVLLTGWEPEDLPPWIDVIPTDAETQNETSAVNPTVPETNEETNAITLNSSSSNSNNNSGNVVRKRLSPWKWLLNRKDIQECVRRLARDDSDVYNHISKLQQVFPDLVISKVNCRGMKVPPGGDEPIPYYEGETPKGEVAEASAGDIDVLANIEEPDISHITLPQTPNCMVTHAGFTTGTGANGEGPPAVEDLEVLFDTLDMGVIPPTSS